ncbi:MAG: FkbM family methyltransferase, partial [Rhodospirillaceae bacterium]|nr:FkbM family methyltransferase [Rhodospirillaceae bacterium]
MKTLLRRVATRLARAPIIDTGLGFRYYQYRPQSLPYAELEAHNIEWAKNIKPGDVVFDIGGNFGTISLLAASRGATTFAFETNIGNLARLQENARLNGWWDRINGFCIAVSDETGMGTMLNNKPQLAHIGLYLEGKRRANIPGVPV